MATLESHAETNGAAAAFKTKTVLVVNAGSPKARFIFQKLKSLDLHIVLLQKENNWASRYADSVIVADPRDEAECLAQIEEHLKGSKVDGALTFWEDDIPLMAAACERFGWIGQPREAALNCRNKLRTRKAMEAHRLQRYSTPFAQIKSLKDLQRETARIGYPCVLKPAWGAESQFVVRLENYDEAKNAFEYLQANVSPKFDAIYTYGTEILLERYIDGAEVDVDMLLQDGVLKFYAFTDNFPTKEPFFIETGDAMPSRHESSDLDAVLAMAKEAVAALGLKNGTVHLEARISPDGPKLIEVNARMGGDYIYDWVKTVWRVDLIEESLRVALGMQSQPNPPSEALTHLVGSYIIPSSSGVISGVSLPYHADKTDYSEKIHDISLLKELGDPVLVPPEGFEAIGWVVGQGRTYAEAEENLHDAMQGVHISIARFDSTSTIGKTRRRNRFNAAQVARRRIQQSARLEKIRGVDPGDLSKLHIGILCNKYEEAAEGEDSESHVHQDLTSVGLNIQKAMESKGRRVTFFDMNETPLPFDKIAEANVDIVFNVCERINNSSLLEPHAAAILDCLGVPYTGSNPSTLALCIDKIKVKKILEYHQLPTPRFDYVFSSDEQIRDDLRYPLIVKPANTDNSIGISNKSVVSSPKELKDQVHSIIKEYKRPVLIEEYIEGDEVDVSILGNEERVKVLPLSRSLFDDMPAGAWHIYPFKAKWSDDPVYNKIKVERPAKYSQKLTALISEICLDAYNIFDCHDYARIEVRVDKFGNPYILEINPNPSINRNDCVPACAEVIGMDYEAFIEEILREAIFRYRARPPYYHLQSALVTL
ncbi:MAG: ATP-grasp domain-containing protein [Elusimicrobia bacterium]|nr:ATP-grasp domain-containing protein [Elusimicrobiota bacterium]